VIVYNMTGGAVRNDSKGHGYYKASRGSKLHKGIDLELPGGPGQAVFAPITGRIERVLYPYTDDLRFEGAVFSNKDITVWAFYFVPGTNLIGKSVSMGEVIGIAQDISLKYIDMGPHIHVQIGKYGEINPLILM